MGIGALLGAAAIGGLGLGAVSLAATPAIASAVAPAAAGGLFSGGFSLGTLGTILSGVGPLLGAFMSKGAADQGASQIATAASAQATATQNEANAQIAATNAGNRQAQIQAQQQRVQAVQSANMAEAGIIAAGGNFGTLASSSVAGGVGSVGSQLATNIGVSNQLTSLQNQVVSETNKGYVYSGQAAAAGISIQAAQARAASAGSVGSLVTGVGTALNTFTNPQVSGAVANIFKV